MLENLPTSDIARAALAAGSIGITAVIVTLILQTHASHQAGPRAVRLFDLAEHLQTFGFLAMLLFIALMLVIIVRA